MAFILCALRSLYHFSSRWPVSQQGLLEQGCLDLPLDKQINRRSFCVSWEMPTDRNLQSRHPWKCWIKTMSWSLRPRMSLRLDQALGETERLELQLKWGEKGDGKGLWAVNLFSGKCLVLVLRFRKTQDLGLHWTRASKLSGGLDRVLFPDNLVTWIKAVIID